MHFQTCLIAVKTRKQLQAPKKFWVSLAKNLEKNVRKLKDKDKNDKEHEGI